MKLFPHAWTAVLLWTLAAVPLSSLFSQALAPAPPAVTSFFPLADVRPGQRGIAYTVFQGVLPEPMEVEILGVLKNSLGPNRDLILARLHGTKPDYTGVVAGMSGSPVYIDGKLLGALSFRIGQFSKEPIAGITPIAEMLDVANINSAALQASSPNAAAARDLQPIETPLLFSGFSQDTLDRFGDRFRALGLTPVAGLGGSSPSTPQPEPLIPGSAVSAIFVRGDLSMAGTCTVTYVDPQRLLACGHPITQAGPISMPMTKTAVVATLASPLNAFKIVNTTETVGSFTQDRAAAIAGRFGLDARMIPVAVEVAGYRPVHFEVVDDKQLTPNTMLVSIYQSLQGTNAAAAEQSYRLAGTLTVAGQPPVTLSGVMAPNAFNTGAINAALYIGERFDRVYQNAAEQLASPEKPTITGLQLHLEALPGRRTAVLDAARLSRTEARAGDTLDLELTVHPYQATPVILHVPLTLPPSLTPGPLRLLVSDGAALDRLLAAAPSPAHPLTLADTIAALNRAHPNDRLYVTLLDRTAQAVLQTGTLQQLPLSMANVFDLLKDTQQLQLNGESAVLLASTPTGYAVTASQTLRLQIR